MKKIRTFILAITLIVTSFTNAFAKEGEKLFRGNCGVCHTIARGKLVGPDLKGVNTRYEESWLLKWIKSSQVMVKSGDKKSVQLFNENDNLVMPDQMLTDDEIKSILTFIQEKEKLIEIESSQNIANDNIASFKNTTRDANGFMLSMFGFSGYIMIMLIGLLLVIIWVMSMSIKKISIDKITKRNKL